MLHALPVLSVRINTSFAWKCRHRMAFFRMHKANFWMKSLIFISVWCDVGLACLQKSVFYWNVRNVLSTWGQFKLYSIYLNIKFLKSFISALSICLLLLTLFPTHHYFLPYCWIRNIRKRFVELIDGNSICAQNFPFTVASVSVQTNSWCSVHQQLLSAIVGPVNKLYCAQLKQEINCNCPQRPIVLQMFPDNQQFSTVKFFPNLSHFDGHIHEGVLVAMIGHCLK